MISSGSKMMTWNGNKKPKACEKFYYHNLKGENGQSSFFQVNPNFSACNSSLLLWSMKIFFLQLCLPFSFHVIDGVLIPVRKTNMQGIIRKQIVNIKKSHCDMKIKWLKLLQLDPYISNKNCKHTIRTKKNRFLVLLNLLS